jgi:hypothetical protein
MVFIFCKVQKPFLFDLINSLDLIEGINLGAVLPQPNKL